MREEQLRDQKQMANERMVTKIKDKEVKVRHVLQEEEFGAKQEKCFFFFLRKEGRRELP